MKKTKGYNNYIKYSYLGFQIAITVTLGVLAGQWLDHHFDNKSNLYTIICSVLAILITLYQTIKNFLSS